MKKGLKLDNYNQRLSIQEVYNDNSLGKKFHIWFTCNQLTLDVDAPAWKFFTNCTEVVDIMKCDIVGVDLHMIKKELIKCGYVEME